MDNVTPLRRPETFSEARGSIQIAARDMGIAPGDPAWPLIVGLTHFLDEIETRTHPVTKEQLDQITQTAVRQLDRRVMHRYLQTHYWQLLASVGLALAFLLAGYGAGWLTWSYGRTCFAARGGVVCQVWTTPPTEAK